MSDENAVPETPVETPATVVEQPVAEVPNAPAPSANSAEQTVSAQFGAPTSADLTTRIAALTPDAQAVLQEVLGHVQDGFDNYSLGVGFSRLADLMK